MTAALIAPKWAEAGLAEATRISDIMFAEQIDGERRWDNWLVRVEVDYVNVSTEDGYRGVIAGMMDATAECEYEHENWSFVRAGDEWLVKAWQVTG